MAGRYTAIVYSFCSLFCSVWSSDVMSSGRPVVIDRNHQYRSIAVSRDTHTHGDRRSCCFSRNFCTKRSAMCIYSRMYDGVLAQGWFLSFEQNFFSHSAVLHPLNLLFGCQHNILTLYRSGNV